MAGKKEARGFGRVRKLPSGRHQAFYSDPNAATRISRTGKVTPVRHAAPTTFTAKIDAERWLAAEQLLIERGEWTPPSLRAMLRAQKAAGIPTFERYATEWITARKVKGKPLAARTRDHYAALLENYLASFGPLPIDAISPELVTAWYDGFKPKTKKHQGHKTDGATTKAHAYSLGRAVMNTAISASGPLAGKANPFAIRGGGQSPGNKREELATAAEVDVMLATIKPEWRAAILLGVWCGLRYGELAELRRGDVDLAKRVLRVKRAVSRSKSAGVHVKTTKSLAGVRNQRIPKSIVPELEQHLRDHVGPGSDALLFPGKGGRHLSSSTFYGKAPVYGRGKQAKGKPDETVIREGNNGWYHARTEAGHPSLHFHDLRATGATLIASQGATIAEVQAFLGDSTPAAAMRYVRAAQSRMDKLTDRMDRLAKRGGW